MKALTILSILISIMALSLCPTYLHADDFYIDPTYGDDTNPGRFDAPWKKIAKANSTLKAGDTVFIKAGTYAETIRPVNSGTSGRYITYTAYNGQNVTIGGNIQSGADLSDRSWIKIDGLEFSETNSYWIDFAPNGSNNYIVNNLFESTGSSMGWSGLFIKDGGYNKIINNKFDATCQPADLVYLYNANHNLIEGNTFGYAQHVALNLRMGKTYYNVIRNNTFSNPIHTNVSLYEGSAYTLLENNIITNAGDDCLDDSCPANRCADQSDPGDGRVNHAGLQVASDYNIIRNNVFANNGFISFSSWSLNKGQLTNHNRIYNNTFHSNYISWDSNGYESYPYDDNIAKNNTISNSIKRNFYFSNTLTSDSNHFIKNNFSGASVLYKNVSGLTQIESSYRSQWKDNLSTDPGFNNPSALNFNLRSNSNLINKGDWLTTITSPSGSGNSFTVVDSKYFSDGYGIVAGDTIQIQNQTVRVKILSIDYNSHKITVNSSISWNSGDGLCLPYTGISPDIGAFEYGIEHSASLLSPPTLGIKN